MTNKEIQGAAKNMKTHTVKPPQLTEYQKGAVKTEVKAEEKTLVAGRAEKAKVNNREGAVKIHGDLITEYEKFPDHDQTAVEELRNKNPLQERKAPEDWQRPVLPQQADQAAQVQDKSLQEKIEQNRKAFEQSIAGRDGGQGRER